MTKTVFDGIIRIIDDNYISRLITVAERNNVSYLQYYKDLTESFETPEACVNASKTEVWSSIEGKFRLTARNDIDSKLGTYFALNPLLVEPRYVGVFEFERICMTRYRTGSHNLRIETGRMCNPIVPREERFCNCSNDVQTLRHVILRCPITELRQKYNITSFETALSNPKILIEVENVLKI